MTRLVAALAALYTSALFRFSAIALLLVFSVLVADQGAPKVRAVLEPVVIVAGILMVLSATANRHLRRARRD